MSLDYGAHRSLCRFADGHQCVDVDGEKEGVSNAALGIAILDADDHHAPWAAGACPLKGLVPGQVLHEGSGPLVVHRGNVEGFDIAKLNPTVEFLMKLATALKVDLGSLFSYQWQRMSEPELKRKLHAMVDKADLERLREVLALMKAREI